MLTLTSWHWQVSRIFIQLIFLKLVLLEANSHQDLLQAFPTNSCPNLRNRTEFMVRQWKYSNEMVMLGTGQSILGSFLQDAIFGDNESQLHSVQIEQPFWIDKTEVTISAFRKFVASTNFMTTAQLLGSSFVFWMELEGQGENRLSNSGKVNANAGQGHGSPWWWLEMKNVSWQTALDRSQSLKDFSNLPVNHVSWLDATAYCFWNGRKRLPTELEWEHACRGGRRDCARFSWGNLTKLNGKHMANIWQGNFPYSNTKKDGYKFRAPVGSFPPAANQYGLYDMNGNVWEWIHDSWIPERSQKSSWSSSASPSCPNHHNRKMPSPDGESSNTVQNVQQNLRVQKGGSFLCHRSHCYRYRCGSRTKGHLSSTASNLGFRCAADIN